MPMLFGFQVPHEAEGNTTAIIIVIYQRNLRNLVYKSPEMPDIGNRQCANFFQLNDTVSVIIIIIIIGAQTSECV